MDACSPCRAIESDRCSAARALRSVTAAAIALIVFQTEFEDALGAAVSKVSAGILFAATFRRSDLCDVFAADAHCLWHVRRGVLGWSDLHPSAAPLAYPAPHCAAAAAPLVWLC